MKGGGLSDKDYVNTRGTAATNKKLSNAFGYTVNYVISFAMQAAVLIRRHAVWLNDCVIFLHLKAAFIWKKTKRIVMHVKIVFELAKHLHYAGNINQILFFLQRFQRQCL